jgi:hypothetical protein
MMMRAVQSAMIVALLSGGHAAARDPFDGERSVEPPSDPLAYVVPPGLYYVTETYVGSVIETTGPTTTYSTTTVHESTGTYARVVDTVPSGVASAFDGLAFNGRGALGDGRALAGTYYENFVLTASGFVPVSIVFFQDDAETRRRESSPSPTPGASVPTRTAAPPLAPSPAPIARVATHNPVTAAPTPRPTQSAPSRPAYRAGVALAQDGPVLASAEVLRGRAVAFWPRALANDAFVPVRSWRLLSAAPDRIWSGDGSTGPFVAQWIRMPSPDAQWLLRFELFTDTTPTVRLEAQIAVAVRSPALID